MRVIKWTLFICLLMAFMEGNAQELNALHIDRGCLYYQASAEAIAPIGEWIEGMPSWYFSIGADFASGNVSNPRIAGPAFPNGYAMEPYVYEGVEYDFESSFLTEADLENFSPAGSYVFSGTGSVIGPFTETIEMDAYSPVSSKRITNFEALQAIDPSLPFLIEWEPFTDVGEMGFIEVDIYSIWPWGVDQFWESPEEEGSFGLDPESTSVEVPAGVIGSDGNTLYQVAVYFTRIEDFIEETVFGSGLKAYVTSSETLAAIAMKTAEGHVDLLPLDWLEDACYGWMYGVSFDWGYSEDLGFIWVACTPGFLYQVSLGWIAYAGGTMTDGCWFYSPALGYLYTRKGLNGWYALADGTWHKMMTP